MCLSPRSWPKYCHCYLHFLLFLCIHNQWSEDVCHSIVIMWRHLYNWMENVFRLTEKVSWTRPAKFDESRCCLATRRTASRRTWRTPSTRRGRRSTGRAGGRRRRRRRRLPPSSPLQIFLHCCCSNCCWWLLSVLAQNLFPENSPSCQMSLSWSCHPQRLLRPTLILETMLKIVQNWFVHSPSLPRLRGSAKVPSCLSVNQANPQVQQNKEGVVNLHQNGRTQWCLVEKLNLQLIWWEGPPWAKWGAGQAGLATGCRKPVSSDWALDQKVRRGKPSRAQTLPTLWGLRCVIRGCQRMEIRKVDQAMPESRNTCHCRMKSHSLGQF